jgi:hypothetical protein
MSFRKICGCGGGKNTDGTNSNNWDIDEHQQQDHQIDENEPDNNKKRRPISPILHCVATLFSRRPFLVLFVTLTVSIILSKLGVSQYGYPDFEDPYLVIYKKRV